MAVLPKNETPIEILFVDDNQTIVEVRFQRPENHIEGFIVHMDNPEDEDYVQLMKWTNLEDLQRKHEAANKQKRDWQQKVENHNVLQEEINDLRHKLDNKESWISKNKGNAGGRIKTVYKDQDIMEVLTKTVSKEDLFAMKIQIFEQEKVRGSQDKVAKSKIRKAQSTLEVLAAAAPMLLGETQEENSE